MLPGVPLGELERLDQCSIEPRLATRWERIEKLQFEEQGLLEQLAKLGVELSEARTRAGEELSSAIEAHLDDLRMAEAEFDLNLVQQVSYAPIFVSQVL
ncbi:MAG: hypothetical protein P8Y02_14635 [Deinococcales bacterium]